MEETQRYLRLDGETPADPGAPPPRAARSSTSTWSTPARSRGSVAPRFDGSALPVDVDELRRGRDHHTRHRPRRLLALPPEGAVGGAGVVPDDAPGAGRGARRRPRRRARHRHAVRRPAAACTRRIDHAGRRDRTGHGCRRGAERGRRAGAPGRRTVAGRLDGRHRALGVRAHRRHVRHPHRGHQPERHHDRHEPHRRSRPQPGRRRHRHREPAPERPRRQGRRRALHLRRPRPREGGPVDQGLLCAGRGGIPPRTRAGRRARERSRTHATQLLRGLQELPDAMQSVLEQRDTIAEIAQPATFRAGATGRSSATG